jgi:hypothetical protein
VSARGELGEHPVDAVSRRRTGPWHHDLPELWLVASCWLRCLAVGVDSSFPGDERQSPARLFARLFLSSQLVAVLSAPAKLLKLERESLDPLEEMENFHGARYAPGRGVRS